MILNDEREVAREEVERQVGNEVGQKVREELRQGGGRRGGSLPGADGGNLGRSGASEILHGGRTLRGRELASGAVDPG